MKKRLFTLTAYVMATCLLISAFPMSAAAKTNTQKANATTIKAKNLTIYIKHTKKLSYSIANKVGKTTFKSSNKKVVKITNKGKVKAIRKGTAYITIANNGAKKKVKVTVKNQNKLNKMVRYSADLSIVKKTLTMDIKDKKKSLKSIYKFTLKHNLDDLLDNNKITTPEYAKYSDQISKKLGKIKYSLTNTKVVKLNKKKRRPDMYDEYGSVIPLKVGQTTLKIKFKGHTYSVKIKVTQPKVLKYNKNGKPDEIIFKGGLTKVCYTSQETYDIQKKMFYDYIIKGNRPKYEYILSYAKKDYAPEDDMHIEKETNDGKNFLWFSCSPCTHVQAVYCSGDYYDGGFYWEFKDYQVDISLSLYKKLYNKAQSIFKEIKIDECKTDYEKVLRFGKWMQDNVHYTDKDHHGGYDSLSSVLLYYNGVCRDWADTTVYLCSLLNIPCALVTSYTHAWNLVKIQGKWYNLDILWNMYFLGDKTTLTYEHHDLTTAEEILSHNSIFIKKITREQEDFVIPS